MINKKMNIDLYQKTQLLGRIARIMLNDPEIPFAIFVADKDRSGTHSVSNCPNDALDLWIRDWIKHESEDTPPPLVEDKSGYIRLNRKGMPEE